MIAWAELKAEVDRWDQLNPKEVDAVLHRLLVREGLLANNPRRRAAANVLSGTRGCIRCRIEAGA